MIIGEGSTEIKKTTFRQLRQNVAKFAAAMKAMGIQNGDRVVGKSYMSCVVNLG